MEQFIVGLFGKASIVVVPIVSGIFSSFLIEAINQSTPKEFGGKLVNAIVSLVFGVLMVFVFPNIILGIPDTIVFVVLNWSFAIMFYHFGGKVAVESIVSGAVKLVKKKAE